MYKKLVIPWENKEDKKVELHLNDADRGGQDSSSACVLDSQLDVDLLLLLALARREGLGTIFIKPGQGINIHVDKANDVWVEFTDPTYLDAFNNLAAKLTPLFKDNSLAAKLGAFYVSLFKDNTLFAQSIDNSGHWRLNFVPDDLCFSQEAFECEFRVYDINNLKGQLTILLKEIDNDIFRFTPNRPVLQEEVTTSVGEALLLLNANSLEMTDPYIFRRALDCFCNDIYNIFLPEGRLFVENNIDYLSSLFQRLGEMEPADIAGRLSEIEDLSQRYTNNAKADDIKKEFDEALADDIKKEFDEALGEILPQRPPWFLRLVASIVERHFAAEFKKQWKKYITLVNDIQNQIKAMTSSTASIAIHKNCAHARDVIIKESWKLKGTKLDVIFDNLRKWLDNHDIRNSACFAVYDIDLYRPGSYKDWFYYFVINDVKLYISHEGREYCLMPFFTKDGKDRIIKLPSHYNSTPVAEAIWYTYLANSSEDFSDTFRFFIRDVTSKCTEICSGNDGDLYDNLLNARYPGGVPLGIGYDIIVRPSGRQLGGHVSLYPNHGGFEE
ncbi:hypothetical protein AGMMS50276_25320 [Synergistales bacterium]|nr:hypothetical protein AGMMS50276_25320 [Synergistales bacterium]